MRTGTSSSLRTAIRNEGSSLFRAIRAAVSRISVEIGDNGGVNGRDSCGVDGDSGEVEAIWHGW